jgi:hypothetical protein
MFKDWLKKCIENIDYKKHISKKKKEKRFGDQNNTQQRVWSMCHVYIERSRSYMF